jgi:hypothetical protein
MHTPPHFDVASAAGSYATFGFLLVGFAFVSLFHYLTERHQQDGPPAPPLPPQALRLIKKHDVKVAMLYAMASLLLTSFLYLELAGEATPSGTPAVSPPWTAAALVPYGVAFGLSVLMLFYSLTLIMLKQSSSLASWSYWIVACVGPAVVLRFLLVAAAQSVAVNCACVPGWPLTRWGIFELVALTAGAAAALMLIGLDWPPLRGLRKRLMNRPTRPSIWVFIGVAVMTGLISVYFTGRGSSDRVSPLVVMSFVWIAAVAVFLFALSCGCVIGPRVNVAHPPPWHLMKSEKNKGNKQSKKNEGKAVGGQHVTGPLAPAGTDPLGAREHGGWPRDTTLTPWPLVEPDTLTGGLAAAGPHQAGASGSDYRNGLVDRVNDARKIGKDGYPTVARDRCQALLEDFERHFGSEAPKTLTVRAYIAHWTGMAGDAAAARDQLGALLPVRERILGISHRDTVATRRQRDFWARRAGSLFPGGHCRAVAR